MEPIKYSYNDDEFNPFLITGYLDKEHFCNREKETANITSLNQGRINITLFALRRMGKTGLIHHLFNSIEKQNKIACLYIDILSTQNMKEFISILTNAIYKRFPENKGIGSKLLETIKSLRPMVSFDELSGTPELSLDFKQSHQYEKTIQQLFEFLDNQNLKIIVAIDEFQQILEYPEKNIEATLRTFIQNLNQTNFIFCGSNQQMMNEIFNDAKRPFFASCTHLKLDEIAYEDYSLFIKKMFNNHHKEISQESIDFILEWTERHTFYTQYVCNRVFAGGSKNIAIDYVRVICKEILLQNEHIYFQYRALLTQGQWKILKAFAKEGKVTQPHAAKFIHQYELGSSALVKRGLDSLLNKEMISISYTENGVVYSVYDKFLMRWLARS